MASTEGSTVEAMSERERQFRSIVSAAGGAIDEDTAELEHFRETLTGAFSGCCCLCEAPRIG